MFLFSSSACSSSNAIALALEAGGREESVTLDVTVEFPEVRDHSVYFVYEVVVVAIILPRIKHVHLPFATQGVLVPIHLVLIPLLHGKYRLQDDKNYPVPPTQTTFTPTVVVCNPVSLIFQARRVSVRETNPRCAH